MEKKRDDRILFQLHGQFYNAQVRQWVLPVAGDAPEASS